MFKGTLVTFARDMPSFATYFVVYDLMRHKFKESRIDLGPVGITIVSGATAGIAGKAKLYIETNFENGVKVHIFWDAHKILQNLPFTFDYVLYIQSKVRRRFCKILWPSQNIWTLPTIKT